MDELKSIYNKITLIFSPNSNVGKTTIANNVAYLFAKKGYLTAVIELDRYTGSSPYINNLDIDKNINKNLKTAVNTFEHNKIKTCFLQSNHNINLFTLSLTKENKLDHLYKFPQNQIEKIINTSKDIFDVIFIDAPSNYIENGLLAAINIHPDQVIQVLDNNYITLEKMKKYDEFFYNANMFLTNVITVINKDEGLVNKKAVKLLNKDLKILKMDKVYTIPYNSRIIKALNEGIILSDVVPSNKKEKVMVNTFNSLFNEIIYKSKVS